MLVERSRRHLGAITDATRSAPYIIGFMVMLITVIARVEAGKIFASLLVGSPLPFGHAPTERPDRSLDLRDAAEPVAPAERDDSTAAWEQLFECPASATEPLHNFGRGCPLGFHPNEKAKPDNCNGYEFCCLNGVVPSPQKSIAALRKAWLAKFPVKIRTNCSLRCSEVGTAFQAYPVGAYHEYYRSSDLP